MVLGRVKNHGDGTGELGGISCTLLMLREY